MNIFANNWKYENVTNINADKRYLQRIKTIQNLLKNQIAHWISHDKDHPAQYLTVLGIR